MRQHPLLNALDTIGLGINSGKVKNLKTLLTIYVAES